MNKQCDFNKFVEKANHIHKNKYTYVENTFISASKRVEIVCSKHGIFEKIGYNHLRIESKGSGCPLCTKEKNRLHPTNFIKEATKIHKDFYNYSLVNYINPKDKVRIICPIHGEFTQRVCNHLIGYGCFSCKVGVKIYHKNFVERSKIKHKNKYTYENVKICKQQKVSITCPIHGEFLQTPAEHLSGRGCDTCASERRGWSFSNWKKACKDEYPYLYLIFLQHLGNSVLKIGRTNDLSKRYINIKNTLNKHGISIQKVYFITDTIKDIFEKEIFYKQIFKKYRAFKEKQNFVGYTEVYTNEILNHINIDEFTLWKTMD